MAESDFLVTLPSNSNMKTHPSNEPANYTVKLAEPLQLEGDWEAALVSVQYTPNWLTFDKAIKLVVTCSDIRVRRYRYPNIYYNGDIGTESETTGLNRVIENIRLEDSYEKIITMSNEIVTPIENITLVLVTLQPKYYESPAALGAHVCSLIQEALLPYEEVKIRYIYDTNLQKGEFVFSPYILQIFTEESTTLGDLLGHNQKPLERRNANSKKLYVLSPYGCKEPSMPKVNSLWIYNNITQNQQVGDSKVPLLGIIPSQSDDRKRVHYTVNPVHFQALNCNHISEISIQIVDDRGNRIPFTKGEDNLVCCLRFRRRKTPMPI